MPDPFIGMDLAAAGDCTIVAFSQSEGGEWTYFKLGADKDPFEICNRARARVFPDVTPPQHDPKFAELMARRERNKAAKAVFGG